jgi:protein-S-isoprenylcysteine O-methyltransferase Ste14
LALLPLTLLRIRLEERGLRDVFGAEYEAYQARVRTLVPFFL